MPIPTSNANFRHNPTAYLAHLFLGLGLTAAALLFGLVFWQLMHLPCSSQPVVKHRDSAPDPPAETQPEIVLDRRSEAAEPLARAPLSHQDLPHERQQKETKPKAAIVEVPPRLPEPPTADQIFEQRLQASEDDLLQQLAAVPELRLLNDAAVRNLRMAERLAQRRVPRNVRVNESVPEVSFSGKREHVHVKNISVHLKIPRDAVLAQVDQIGFEYSMNLQEEMRRAARHAGLRLQSKSRLSNQTATEMAELSKALRNQGFVNVPGVAATHRLAAADAASRKIEKFQHWCDQHHLEQLKGTMPTLLQMLQIENEPTRLLLVRELKRSLRMGATAQLAGRALMDLSPQVRQAAVVGLEGRSAEEYVPILLRGLRYPWPPVADHAAVALRTLKPTDAITPLVDLLDLPSPSSPLCDDVTGKCTVRELVRLNHLRNCLLCHEPSLNEQDGLVRGLVPIPGSPLPRSTTARPGYYEGTGDFVRADVTYLHQDFSVTLPDLDAGAWPREQRFDFVTRLRTLPPSEIAERPAAIDNYPQRDAVLYALRGLTGKDGGNSSSRWRELLGLSAVNPQRETTRPVLENIAVIPIDRQR